MMAGLVSARAVGWERKVWVVGSGAAAGCTGAVGAEAVARAGSRRAVVAGRTLGCRF